MSHTAFHSNLALEVEDGRLVFRPKHTVALSHAKIARARLQGWPAPFTGRTSAATALLFEDLVTRIGEGCGPSPSGTRSPR